MIQVSNISKSYAEQTLFDGVSFSINSGERLGLVGRNGHGKTTLFRILAGIETTDDGDIHCPDDYKIGYLSQHLKFSKSTALDEAAEALPTIDGWKEIYRAEAILQGLGFDAETQQKSPEALSGGYQVRLQLTKLILSAPNLLLLDEPTNYLDIVSLRWLTQFLRSWPGELILITHDHGFMDDVTTHTLGIHRRGVRKIKGATAKYYEQLALEEEIHEQRRKNQEKKIEEAERFIRAFRAKASKAKAVQSRVKALEKMDTLEKLEEIAGLDFKFTHQPFPGKRLLEIENISFHYPGQSENLIERLSLLLGPTDRIGVIGKNGKGKSTLLRLIAQELTPVDGEIIHRTNMKLAYFGQTNVERLTLEKTIEEELLEATVTYNRSQARGIAGCMMFEGDMALKKIAVLSGGEKSRVMLGKILLTPANLILLDEPTNHLDMHSTDALQTALEDFPGAVIVVTHSEMLLRAVATKLLVFDRDKVELFDGGYDDFLRRVGWSEEGAVSEVTRSESVGGERLSKKEMRKARADVTQRRSKVLGPLTREAAQLEEDIDSIEKQIAENTSRLIEITKDGFGSEGQQLSEEIASMKQEIENKFSRLEELLPEIEQLEKKFDQELAALQ